MVEELVEPKAFPEGTKYELHFLHPEGDSGSVRYCVLTTDAEDTETWGDSEVATQESDILNLLQLFCPDRVTASRQIRGLPPDHPAFWAWRLVGLYKKGLI